MILDGILRTVRRAARPGPADDFWYQKVLGFGTNVTPDSAMQTTAVWACVAVRARLVAMLPLRVMEETPDGRRRKATEHPWHRALYRQPNAWQTSYEFREMMEGHVALRGNAYAAKVRGDAGMTLVPLNPDRMKVVSLTGGRLGYMFQRASGEQVPLTQDEVLHLRGLTLDGVVGLNPIEYNRRAIELSQQGEHHGLSFFQNAGKPGGVLKLPAGHHLKDEDEFNDLKNQWRDAQTADNLYKVAILEDGMEWQQIGLNNQDSQWLESRRFQVPEICRIFHVPPHTIFSAIEHGHTYANIEQTDLALVKHTGLPRYVSWEQAIQRDLLDDPYYAKFTLEALLRADSKTRSEFYKVMVDLGVFSVNEVRELEDRDPIDGGDEYRTAAAAPAIAPAAMAEVLDRIDMLSEDQRERAHAVLASIGLVRTEADEHAETAVRHLDGSVGRITACVDAAADRTAVEAGEAAGRSVAEHDAAEAVRHGQTREVVEGCVDAVASNLTERRKRIAEAARAVAGADIQDLEKASKHWGTDKWDAKRFDAWYPAHWGDGGKGRERTASRLGDLADCDRLAAWCDATIRELHAASDVGLLLNRWTERRATDLTAFLSNQQPSEKENGHEPTQLDE